MYGMSIYINFKFFSGLKNFICNFSTTSENVCASTLMCSTGLQQEQRELKKH